MPRVLAVQLPLSRHPVFSFRLAPAWTVAGDTLNSVKYDIITNERRRGRVTSVRKNRCFSSRWHNAPKVFDVEPCGSPSKGHFGGCPIYSETTVIGCLPAWAPSSLAFGRPDGRMPLGGRGDLVNATFCFSKSFCVQDSYHERISVGMEADDCKLVSLSPSSFFLLLDRGAGP